MTAATAVAPHCVVNILKSYLITFGTKQPKLHANYQKYNDALSMKAKIYHIFVDVIFCFIDRIYAVDVLLLT